MLPLHLKRNMLPFHLKRNMLPFHEMIPFHFFSYYSCPRKIQGIVRSFDKVHCLFVYIEP